MRIKQTGKPRARKTVAKKSMPSPAPETVAGAKQDASPKPTKATPKSTTKAPKNKTNTLATATPNNQPRELSDADINKIKRFLDNNTKPFNVSIHAPTRKRKRSDEGGPHIQNDFFVPELSVQYEITPNSTWECLRRYKKFTVGNESIATGQCILVKHDDQDEDQRVDIAAQWKAKVLEVRALDSEHVYIRVAWLNRPEDLDTGRKPYHGEYELIPSNHMDIIDAMSVNGSLEVMEWNEADEDAPMPMEEQYFWRQTFDARQKTLSKLKLICVDEAPQNPDSTIIQCDNPDCLKWLHLSCIAVDAVKEAESDSAPVAPPKPTINGTGKKGSAAKKKKHKNSDENLLRTTINSNGKDSIGKGAMVRYMIRHESGDRRFAAEVFLKDTLPHSSEDSEAPDKNEVVVFDANGEEERRPVCCLFCRAEIED